MNLFGAIFFLLLAKYTLEVQPSIPLFIVEQHNHCNKFLFKHYINNKEKYDKGLPIIHVDSHSDADLTDDPLKVVNFKKTNIKDIKQFNIKNFIKGTLIGDFIAPAQVMGLMGRNVLWILPSWKNSSFEMQSGTTHKIFLGTNKEKDGKVRICYKEHPEELMKDSILKKQMEESRYFSINDLIRTKQDRCKSDKSLDLVTWNVKTIDQAVSQTGMRFWNDEIKKKKEFILDIDLDYFATRNARIDKYAVYKKYFNALKEIFNGREFCRNKDKNGILIINQTLKEMFWEGLRFSGSFEKYKYHPSLNFWCGGKRRGFKNMKKLSKLVDEMMEKINFEQLFTLKHVQDFPNISCNNEFFGLCPHYMWDEPYYKSSKYEIYENLHKMKEYLLYLKNELNAIPISIIIARSYPYSFEDLRYFIENKTLEMLKHVYIDHDLKEEFYENLKPEVYRPPKVEKNFKIKFNTNAEKSKKNNVKILNEIKNLENYMTKVKIPFYKFDKKILKKYKKLAK